ncbi:MAG: pyruvate formate lyase-activating protein [Bacilli bacterium]|nr:pyruvate formate lyase-activating protein [Bacilli bacterium]
MGSVASIETFGTQDGPGIRTVIFFNECKLRCIYCHNPEMWNKGIKNYSVEELFLRIIKNKEYYGENGGVTFSGGEPLLHSEFLLELCKKLKNENIHIALDTAGIAEVDYEELLKYVDLIIFDVKHINEEGYKLITRTNNFNKANKFLSVANKLNKKFWIRQVIVPGIMDNCDYLIGLKEYLKRINNIEKIEFLPYHKLGCEKYIKIGIPYYCENIKEMDKITCENLYNKFLEIYNDNND